MNRWGIGLGALAVLVAVAPGCATYSDKMKGARSAVSAGDYAKGIAEVRGKPLQGDLLSGLIQLMTARQTNNRHSIIRLGPGGNPAILHPL